LRFINIIYKLIILIFLSCSPGGPVTPQDSYKAVAECILDKDYKRFYGLISDNTKDKIRAYGDKLKKLSKKQLDSVALSYGLEAEKLKGLDDVELSALLFMSDRSRSSLLWMKKDKMSSFDISGSFSKILTEGGRTVIFTKKGPYWEIDLSDL